MNWKRLFKITVISILYMMLVGFELPKISPVELKNISNENPFVDLDQLIKRGGDYMSGDIFNDSEGDSPKDQVASMEKNDDTDVAKTDISIRVIGKKTYFNNILVSGNAIDASISKIKKGALVVLIDDYADYNVFSSIKEKLNGKGIVYKTETR